MHSIKRKLKLLVPRIYKLLSVAEHKRNSDKKKFKAVYPNTKIFEPIRRGDQKIYSLSNQDYIIKEAFFKEKKCGFYCDIGGNHPVRLNNTKYFEALGWGGIAFEPLPHFGKLCRKHRKAKFFPFALSDREGSTSFIVDQCGDKETSHIKATSLALNNTDKIRIFQNVMNEEKCDHIDYMSLDVEGHEMALLKGIEFKKTKINVLTIENISGHRRCVDDNIRNFMLENDYIFWGRIMGSDDIYAHKDFKQSIR